MDYLFKDNFMKEIKEGSKKVHFMLNLGVSEEFALLASRGFPRIMEPIYTFAHNSQENYDGSVPSQAPPSQIYRRNKPLPL